MTAYKIYHYFQWILLAILLLLAAIGCSNLQHTGYIKAGVYAHETTSYDYDSWDYIEHGKYKLDIKERIQDGKWALEINPILHMGSNWPGVTESYSPNWGYLDTTISLYYNVFAGASIFYSKELGYRLISPCDQYQWSEYNRDLLGVAYAW